MAYFRVQALRLVHQADWHLGIGTCLGSDLRLVPSSPEVVSAALGHGFSRRGPLRSFKKDCRGSCRQLQGDSISLTNFIKFHQVLYDITKAILSLI